MTKPIPPVRTGQGDYARDHWPTPTIPRFAWFSMGIIAGCVLAAILSL